MSTHEYLPILVSALSVLLVGYWNPKMLRPKPTPSTISTGTEHVDFKWLALVALFSGAATVMLMPSMKSYKIV